MRETSFTEEFSRMKLQGHKSDGYEEEFSILSRSGILQLSNQLESDARYVMYTTIVLFSYPRRVRHELVQSPTIYP